MDRAYQELCQEFLEELKDNEIASIVENYDEIRNDVSSVAGLMRFLKDEKLVTARNVNFLERIAKLAKNAYLEFAVSHYAKKLSGSAEESKPDSRFDDRYVTSNLPQLHSDYVHRDDELRLRELIENPNTPREKTRFYALVGEEGTGKTQSAVWYCHNAKCRYEVVRFIRGDGPDAFRNDMNDFMEEMGISCHNLGYETALEELKGKLAMMISWLVVITNLDGLSVNHIRDSLSNARGVVIFTAICSDVLYEERTMQIKPYARKEALASFRTIMETNEVQKSVMLKITKILGYNPLAISICAAYVNGECCENKNPNKQITEDIKSLINELKADEHEISIIKMYKRAVKKLKEKSEDAWDLACKISIMNAIGIRMEFLECVLLKPSASLDFCIESIQRLGLIRIVEGNRVVMHRSTRDMVLGIMMAEDNLVPILEDVIDSLWVVWRWSNADMSVWRLKQEEGEHVSELWKIMNRRVDPERRGQLVKMYSDYAYFIINVRGDLRMAEHKLRDIESLPEFKDEETPVEKSVRYFYLENVLYVWGWLYDSTGECETALKCYKEGLELCKADETVPWEEAIKYHNNIANCYSRMNNHSKALKEYRRALILYLDQENENGGIGEVCSYIVSVYCRMGKCLHEMKKYRKALVKFEKALTIHQKLCGGVGCSLSSEQTGKIHNCMGTTYYAMRDLPSALECFKTCLKVYKSIYGAENHSDVAESYNNVACVYFYQRKYAEAKPLLQKAYDMWCMTIGEDHPDAVVCKQLIESCNHLMGVLDDIYTLLDAKKTE